MQIKDKVLDVPVIQGGMGVGVSLSSLAGAVAANGACGVISSVNAGYDEQDFKSSPFKANLRALDYHIKRAKQIAAESTKKGLVAVNIMTAVSHYEESCKTAVSAGADIIISGAGLPLNLPQFTKGTDTLAAPIVSSGRAARIIMKTYKKHYDVYPDMFIIEGSMAGGHLGFGADDITQGKTQSNDEILSDVLAVIEESGADIPVFVAGGVFDGKDMAPVSYTHLTLPTQVYRLRQDSLLPMNVMLQIHLNRLLLMQREKTSVLLKVLLECRHVQLTAHCLKGLMQEKPSRQENVMVVLQHVRRMTVYHIA